MSRKRKRTRRSRQEIQDLIAEFRASELSQSEFARRTGLSQSVLGRWIRREEPAPGALVRVDVKRAEATDMPSASKIEIVVGGEPTVCVHPGFDEETLVRVLKVLRRC